MSYLHIENLYRNQDILLFRECYALEKIHGTSAHVSLREGKLYLSPGGVTAANFGKIFDSEALHARLLQIGEPHVVVFGEAYGGSCQKMAATYGPFLKFAAFEVRVGDAWLTVPEMERVALSLGLEVVPWERISTDLTALDAARDAPSVQAALNGMGGDKKREGVVLRPLIEVTKSSGERIIAKHKQQAFEERSTSQKVVDPSKLVVLAEAEGIANEWVTHNRLAHILDKIPGPHEMRHTPEVIRAMISDVYREGAGEIVESKDAERAIGKRAAALFKSHIFNEKRDLEQDKKEEEV